MPLGELSLITWMQRPEKTGILLSLPPVAQFISVEAG
jgi:hypothetical protein